ncbi:MAG TPA: DUF1844 domain-containing protein [Terriglobales bacterium]
MAEKKQDFVVTDRRKFTEEGELRPDTPAEEPRVEEPKPLAAGKGKEAGSIPEAPAQPSGPSQAEHSAQKQAYHESGKRIDQAIGSQGQIDPKEFEMSFERLIGSLYMTALVQLGAIQEENKPVQPDIIGARQTIDTLSLLQDKTKGNLTSAEQNLLQNALFELRMAFVEITNSLTRPPQNPGLSGAGVKR